MSMFADHYKEKYKCDTIETENGFVVYQIHENEFFIREYHIASDKRLSNAHVYFFDEICRLAEEAGCDFISASVDIKSQDPETPLIFNLKNGFKLNSLSGNRIILTRELGDGWRKSVKEG